MKTFECVYRKRGLTNSDELVTTVEANNYFEARCKASEMIGEECVVLKVVTKKENE